MVDASGDAADFPRAPFAGVDTRTVKEMESAYVPMLVLPADEWDRHWPRAPPCPARTPALTDRTPTLRCSATPLPAAA